MKSIKKIVAVLPIILWLIFILWIGVSEYIRIAIQAHPEIIDSYHFGAESMIAHGGEKYRSALSYAQSNLISAIISFFTIVLILMIISKAKYNQVLKAYFFGILVILLLMLVYGI